jgi:hypothetical protein
MSNSQIKISTCDPNSRKKPRLEETQIKNDLLVIEPSPQGIVKNSEHLLEGITNANIFHSSLEIN